MNLKTFVNLAKLYSNLGAAVQEQLDDAVETERYEDVCAGRLIVHNFLMPASAIAEEEDEEELHDELTDLQEILRADYIIREALPRV